MGKTNVFPPVLTTMIKQLIFSTHLDTSAFRHCQTFLQFPKRSPGQQNHYARGKTHLVYKFCLLDISITHIIGIKMNTFLDDIYSKVPDRFLELLHSVQRSSLNSNLHMNEDLFYRPVTKFIIRLLFLIFHPRKAYFHLVHQAA